MTLSGGKLLITLLAFLLLGGAGGAYVANQTQTVTPTPRYVATPEGTPSPTSTINLKFSPAPGFENGKVPAGAATPADVDQIKRNGLNYFDALKGAQPGAEVTILKISGAFAVTTAGPKASTGNPTQVLKKVNGVWMPLWQGTGAPPDELFQLYGAPQNIFG